MNAPPRHLGAFTLVEVVVASSILAIVGLTVFLVLNSGMVLYAKNTAINSAHQQARMGVEQMLTNLHNAVSIPQLTNANLQPVPEIGANGLPAAAAGISFQIFDSGPFPVIVDATAASTSLDLYCPGFSPPASARLNIPSHKIELDITSSVDLGGGVRRFNFAAPIGMDVDVDGTGIDGQAGVNYVITAFLTTRLSYAVVQKELRYFPTSNLASYKVLTRSLLTDTPFTVPLSASGSLQNRYVAAVSLSTSEKGSNQRGYGAVNMFISSLIPFRCRLTNTQ